MKDLTNIDPAWAWSPYTPTPQNPWNRNKVAHLYRRAAFGANAEQLQQGNRNKPQDLVASFFENTDATKTFAKEAQFLAKTVVSGNKPENLSAWWLYKMLNTPNPLQEKLTLFWHGHFATSASKVKSSPLMFQQNELLYKHAKGSFKEMVFSIAKDPAMLIYLDSTNNRKTHPNENFARELMELFSLGVDQYTEKDIQELARCLTGWEVKRDKTKFYKHHHDYGEKKLFKKQGKFDHTEAITLVLDQPSCSEFIARKLVRFFVLDEPEIPTQLIAPIAQTFRESNFDIAQIVRRIIGSEFFFSEYAIGQKIKSPVELAVGTLRALEGSTNINNLAERTRQLGQGLFFPPSVKGWDGGRTWINTSTLLGRANLIRDILTHEESRFAKEKIEKFAEKKNNETSEAIVDWALEILVAVPIPKESHNTLIQLYENKNDNNRQRIINLFHAISTLPEFQLA